MIAQNSAIMYFRLIITTLIGLYSSRLLLSELGAAQFGLYSLIGGVITLLNILNTTMISTSNRFIALQIGRNNLIELNKIFNTLLVVHLIFGIVLLLLVEILGVWYVKNYLNLGGININDALFVLHTTAFGAILTTLVIPYQGLVTAYEKFNFKAFTEVLNSLLNLAAILILTKVELDKLRFYALIILFVQGIISSIYVFYGFLKHKNIITFNLNKNFKDYIDVSKFFTWQLTYLVGSVTTRQGGAIVMNSFFGTVVNAAYGLGSRIFEFVYAFVKNLNQVALPQIMKSYSSGNTERGLTLIYRLSKYTYFIMLIPAFPIMLSMDFILKIWLKEVPPFTGYFAIFMIIHGLVSCLESGFDGFIDASGRIKNTKLFFSILFPSSLFFVYILYKFNFPPYTFTILLIICEIIFLIYQTFVLRSISDFDIKLYNSQTILPVLLVNIFLVPLWIIKYFLHDNLFNFMFISIISITVTLFAVYFIGLDKNEKDILRKSLSWYILKISNKE
jgi:O-antigen/teichoic acid export membrane protein